MKHTPAPWTLTDEYGAEIMGNGKIVAVAMNQMLATKKQQAIGVLGFDAIDELKSNALLIAAAPELLEALITARREIWELVHHCTSQQQFDELYGFIDLAIAKAGGE